MGVYIYQSGTEKELKNAFIGGVRVPGANTFGYYTFDDQNASQITDFSGNGNNLTGGTMPSYTLVQGSNYAGNFANVSGSVAPNRSIGFGTSYTILVWAKVTTEASMYFTGIQASHQQSIIYGYSSGTFEFYGDNYRTTIKSGASLNTWYLIGYTRSGASIKTYVNGVAGGTASYYNEGLSSGTLHLGSSRDGDRVKGQIGECIIEDKVWTAQEVADYYNQTKGNYEYKIISCDFTQGDQGFSITEAHGGATTGRDSNGFYIVSGYSWGAGCRLQIPSTITSMGTPKLIKVYGKNINNNGGVGISEGIDTNFIRAWGNAINISSSRGPVNSTSVTALSEDVFVIDLENEDCYMESSPSTMAVIYPSPILTLWNNSTLNLCIMSSNKNSYGYLQKAEFYF